MQTLILKIQSAMKSKFLMVLISTCLCVGNLFAQIQTSIMAYPSQSNGSIKLRWATNNPQIWLTGNTKGYYIKREKLDNSNNVLATVWLNGGAAIMPLAKGADSLTTPWKPYFTYTVTNGDTTYNYPNHVTMFGAIYGEVSAFQNNITKVTALTDSTSTTVQSSSYTGNQTTDDPIERHFSAIIASEMSFEAAKLGGLGYEDNTAISTEKYRYSIYASTVINTAPTVIQTTICNFITITNVIPANANRTDNCEEIILDEGFESDPVSGKEYIVDPIIEINNTTTSTPSGIDSQILAVSVPVSFITPPEALPGITIEGDFKADGSNVIKWSLPSTTPLKRFDIHRKTDLEGTWQKINPSPVYNLNDTTSSNTIYYTDYTIVNSLSKTMISGGDTITTKAGLSKDIFKTYYYKVIGYNIFDESSSFSNESYGRALDAMEIYPRIKTYTLNQGTPNYRVDLNIDFFTGIDSIPNTFKGAIVQSIELQVSTTGQPDSFQKIPAPDSSANVPVSALTHDFLIPSTQTNVFYYRLKATYSGARQPNYSSPIMIQLVDDTPPALPTISIVSGYPKIENGKVKVKLKWTKNSEADFSGYRIFRKNIATETAMNITKEFTDESDTQLYNPVAINNEVFLENELSATSLNKKIYYQIMTVDKRFNQSKLSDSIEVIRPNLVPPVLPVFNTIIDPLNKTIFRDSSGIAIATIKWSVSADPDIDKYELFRFNTKNFNLTGATPIATFLPSSFLNIEGDNLFLKYSDKTIQLGATYVYVVRIKDKYLTSTEFISERPLVVEVPIIMKNIALKNLTTFTQTNRKDPDWIELKWTIANPTDVLEYEIYRGEFKGDFVPANVDDKIKVSSWKILSPDYLSIKDKNLTVGNSYRYRIRAKFKNGTFTDWKSIDEVNF